jgi:hypothetical protein
MGLVDDILKGLPVNPVLREQVSQLNAQKAAADTENAILKDDLHEAKADIAKLKKQVEELTHKDDLSDVEIDLIKRISETGVDNSTTSIMSQWFDGPEARLEYHFNRLSDADYIVLVYGDDFGGHYAPTQKGLALLVEKNLI